MVRRVHVAWLMGHDEWRNKFSRWDCRPRGLIVGEADLPQHTFTDCAGAYYWHLQPFVEARPQEHWPRSCCCEYDIGLGAPCALSLFQVRAIASS
jgi:hypothetical protein